jgi:glutaredoxin 2
MKELMTELALIDGTFKVADAREILEKLIDFKINFHRIRSLESELRFGEKDAHSQARIKSLQACKVQLEGLLQEASAVSGELEINTTIQINIKP